MEKKTKPNALELIVEDNIECKTKQDTHLYLDNKGASRTNVSLYKDEVQLNTTITIMDGCTRNSNYNIYFPSKEMFKAFQKYIGTVNVDTAA